MTASAVSPASDSLSQTAISFAFVQELATEMSKGPIELPSYPDVAARVRRILADDNVTPAKIVEVVGSEPALAARLLRVANSAALNTTGKPISDLKSAVTRLGFNVIRTAATAFAVSQVKQAQSLKGLEQPLDLLWQRSALVAATAYVTARNARGVNADEAMLAGLLHGVGKLYLLTRAKRHPKLFADPVAYEEVVTGWHANIAKAILENWDMPESIVQAVHLHDDIYRENDGAADLTDVLIVGNQLATYRNRPDELEKNLQLVTAVDRLRLTTSKLKAILETSGEQIDALYSTLGR